MSVIVNTTGFSSEDDTPEFIEFDALRASGAEHPVAVDLPNDIAITDVVPFFPWIKTIRIPFPNVADGRGFSLARRLRQAGYDGHLRAEGHLIVDQFPMALQSGFDELEIDDLLAARQPEHHWVRAANWQAGRYQTRLLKSA